VARYGDHRGVLWGLSLVCCKFGCFGVGHEDLTAGTGLSDGHLQFKLLWSACPVVITSHQPKEDSAS
jgi:hypothetical protein